MCDRKLFNDSYETRTDLRRSMRRPINDKGQTFFGRQEPFLVKVHKPVTLLGRFLGITFLKGARARKISTDGGGSARKIECKNRAAAKLALKSDPAVMGLDDGFHQTKSQSQSRL
jgi:hypothetical protein